MRYHNITKENMLNGDGLRTVLWLAGCSHACPGCQNPVTWDVKGGLPFGEEAKQELFEALAPSWISGVTFSGGDPLHWQNRKEVGNLIEEVPGKDDLAVYRISVGRHLGSSVSEKRGCPGGRTVRGSRKRCDPALERQREPESHRCETDVKK